MTKKENNDCPIKSAKHSGSKIKIIFLLCFVAICVIFSVTLSFSSNIELENVLEGFTVNYTVNVNVSGDTTETDVDWCYAVYDNDILTARVASLMEETCTGTKTTAYKLTLRFTNDGDSNAGISFDYAITGDGKCKISGVETDGTSTYVREVAAGETLIITIESKEQDNSFSQIVLTNIALIDRNAEHTLTFNAAEGGTFTASGQPVNEALTVTSSFAQGTAVNATPASGYSFLFWLDENDQIISKKASDTIKPTRDMTIYPLFVSNTKTPTIFVVDNTVLYDFNEAATAAITSRNHTVVLAKSATLPAGEYTVPGGVTLLIPMDENYILYGSQPDLVSGSHTNPSAFVIMTLSQNAHITVEDGGAISVISKLSAEGTGSGSWNATPSGKHGRIDLQAGSEITLESGSKLYCYGYIAGEGTVNALSGSEVWEAFQIRSWRGGTASTSMPNNLFMFSQYYVQNIEATLKLNAGASEHVMTAINASNAQYTANAIFIGDDGLFSLSNGYVTKKYDGLRDRTIFDVYGNLTLNNLTLSNLPMIGTISTDTVSYLPINSNISITLHSGQTIIGVNLSFLPGCEITVDEGAELELLASKEVFLYDADNWGPYAAAGQKLVPVGYSTVNGTTTVRTQADLIDVLFDLNGTLTLNGHLYTTGSAEDTTLGANITSSSKTGRIIFAADEPGETEETYQATQGGSSGTTMTSVSIPVSSAKLHNADGTYTLTTGAAGGDTYVYCPYCDVWGLDEDHAHTGTVIWENWDKTELMREDVAYGVVPEYTGATPEKVSNDPRFNYVFHDWYQTRTVVSGEVTKYTAEFKAFSTDPAQKDDALKFTTAALTLENDITVNFKISKNAVDNAGFNLLYTIFTVNNEAKIVTGYEKDGYYVFDCKGVFPKYLNNRIFATLYAEKDGTLYTETTSYRAATYCYSLFKNPGTDAPELLKKLAVDTLLYGEAAQLHFNYRTDALCTSKLTAEHMAYASTSTGELVNRLSIEKTIENASASWKAATLFLNNSIDFRFQFSHTNGTEGLYAIMTDTVTGRTWRVSSFESAKDSNTGNVIADNYWVFFKGLNASQMNNEVEVVIYNTDDEQISRTLHYSIESYVKYTVENSTNEKLLNLVECIIKYGNSAKAYVNRNN